MGIYDAVLPKDAPTTDPDSKRQEKIDRIKSEIGKPDAVTLGMVYASLRKEKADIEERLYSVGLRISAVEQLLMDSQAAADAEWGQYGAKDNAIRLASGDVIRIDREPQGKVVDKEAFRLWCIENGYERQLQLWPSRMNSICKERLKAGEPEPDGCDISTYKKIVFTPHKEK